ASAGGVTTAGVSTIGAGAASGIAGAGGAAAAAFLAGARFSGAASTAGKASLALRTAGASIVEEAVLTYSPFSFSHSMRTLLWRPSSFASADTRVLPGT